MRKLSTEDTFKMGRLIAGTNMTEEIKKAFAEGKKKDADEEEIGLDVCMNMICLCSGKKTEEQFYDLMAGITEKTEEQVKTQSLETTISDIKQICKENNVVNFLKSASRLSEIIKKSKT